MSNERAIVKLGAATAVVVGFMLAAQPAPAAEVTVYGGPSYTPGVGGFKGTRDGWMTFDAFATVNDAGVAAGATVKYDAAGRNLGTRAFRWDASGAPPVELGTLATYSHFDEKTSTTVSGYSAVGVSAINNAGTIVGWGTKSAGYAYPVRWDASTAAATELHRLDHLYPLDYSFNGQVLAINDAGTAVGFSEIWPSTSPVIFERAARWEGPGNGVTALGYPDTSDNPSRAVAINDAGTIIGYDIYGSAGFRWNASGGPPEVLAGEPRAINDFGVAVGVVGVPDTGYGATPVRWDASGARTLLDGLEPKVAGEVYAYAYAVDINNAGTAVGYASLPGDDNQRAVRWDATATAATVLGTVESLDASYKSYVARFINESGAIVGHVDNFIEPGRAVYWSRDGLAIDLNTLIDPAGGWTLNEVQGFSDMGWITGIGTYDPDGPGGQPAYARMFLMQVPDAVVPEPGGLAILGIACLVTVQCRRRRRQVNLA